MKKILIIILFLVLFLTTGCDLFKRDEMEGIDIITSNYAIEYVTKELYGTSSKIESIFPRGADLRTYKLTNKQIKDLSSNNLFVYNGQSDEKEYATAMLNKNKNIKIIDASYGIETHYSKYDVWLNPSNVLMIAQNIRNELLEYISSPYVINEINNKYDKLKINITELDTEYKKAADNSLNKTIISYDESLKFLEKYGFKVINLTENGKELEKNINSAKELINNKTLSYIFITEYTEDTDLLKTFIGLGTNKLTFRVLEIISEDDMANNDDYLSIMHNNIEQIKKETYK